MDAAATYAERGATCRRVIRRYYRAKMSYYFMPHFVIDLLLRRVTRLKSRWLPPHIIRHTPHASQHMPRRLVRLHFITPLLPPYAYHNKDDATSFRFRCRKMSLPCAAESISCLMPARHRQLMSPAHYDAICHIMLPRRRDVLPPCITDTCERHTLFIRHGAAYTLFFHATLGLHEP